MKRHRERGGNFTKMMTQPFYAWALLGSEEGVMEAQRPRIRGVFQADRVGSLPTEETGSSVVYAQRRQEAVWSMQESQYQTAQCSHTPTPNQCGFPFTQRPAVSHPIQAACRTEQHWAMFSSLPGLMETPGNSSACTDK